MIINTTAGKTYAVTPQTDCTVSTPDGVLIASCPAGGQTCFIAPCAEVEVSDDSALVTESFKGALGGSSASGGSNVFQTITVTGAATFSGGITATEGTTTLGNVITANISVQRVDVAGPASFTHGVTMWQTLNVYGSTTVESLLISGCGVYIGKTPTGSRLESRNGDFAIGPGGRNAVVFEFLKDGMAIRSSIKKQSAGSLGLSSTSLLNMDEGDARWSKVRTDLTEDHYTALAAKDATTIYITSDTGKVYIGNHAIN